MDKKKFEEKITRKVLKKIEDKLLLQDVTGGTDGDDTREAVNCYVIEQEDWDKLKAKILSRFLPT